MMNMSWGDVKKATEGAPEPESEISTTGNAPEEIGAVLAEINASGFSMDDKRRIADWLNRSIDCVRREAHAARLTPEECLKAFEAELVGCETEPERDAARKRCIGHMKRSLGMLP